MEPVRGVGVNPLFTSNLISEQPAEKGSTLFVIKVVLVTPTLSSTSKGDIGIEQTILRLKVNDI